MLVPRFYSRSELYLVYHYQLISFEQLAGSYEGVGRYEVRRNRVSKLSMMVRMFSLKATELIRQT